VQVVADYGPLEVEAGDFTTVAQGAKPWSSWWYPLWQDTLFHSDPGDLSPLEKYDQYVRRSGYYDPGAALFEQQNLYQPRGEGWMGHCDAWALASIMQPEPKTPMIYYGIRFNVKDLKALIIKTYDGVQDLKHYGQRNNGQWDSVYEDIYPEQFHRFLQAEIFEKKKQFIMDHDAGIEVWNVPVYRAQTRVTADASDDHVMHVKTWLWTASPHVDDYNFVGTKEVILDYTYDLYGVKQPDGKFKVEFGLWTDRSRWDHPDYVIPKPDQIERKSRNQKIDPAIVDRIVRGF
jgi:hypothetical protein